MIHPVPGREASSIGVATRSPADVDLGGREYADMDGTPVEPELPEAARTSIGRVAITHISA